jgi:hypothetical protein
MAESPAVATGALAPAAGKRLAVEICAESREELFVSRTCSEGESEQMALVFPVTRERLTGFVPTGGLNEKRRQSQGQKKEQRAAEAAQACSHHACAA